MRIHELAPRSAASDCCVAGGASGVQTAHLAGFEDA